MKKLIFVLWLIFTILTLVVAGYVLYTRGQANVWFLIPMVLAITFGSLYQDKYRNKLR